MALYGKAALTVCRTATQGYVQVYAGSPVPDDILDEDAKRLLDEGYLEKRADAPSGDDPASLVPTEFTEPPAKSADLATWRAFAASNLGGMSPEEADVAKKKDLIAKYLPADAGGTSGDGSDNT
jgi:hypothetical protein